MHATLAAFDVDGTLTTRDTFLPFLVRATSPGAVARSLACRPGLAVAAGRGDRDRLKEAVVAELLGDRPAAELAELGRRHAGTIAQRWLRPDVVARLGWHRRAGHATVLVSASLRCYLEPLAGLLGVDDVLATDLEVDDRGRTTGRLRGTNCRGEEKAARVRARFGPAVRLAYAYGNSTADDALLALAQVPVRVGRRPLATVPGLLAA